MIIGIYLKNISPSAGGGFTFQETVLKPLLTNLSQHKIKVFYYGDPHVSQSHIEYVCLGKNRFLNLLKKIYYSAAKRLQYPVYRLNRFLKINVGYPYASVLDKHSREHKTDLMWFPTPDYEFVECPYICTVWDLEHRMQPYFPEVSQKGQWQEREKHYKNLLPRASYVITGTQTGKDEISLFYGVHPERIRLLPHPTPAFALKARQSLNKPKYSLKNPYIVYPAQFWAHKNHYTILKTIQKLDHMDVVFVGSDKGNKNYIYNLAKKMNILDRVHFLGFIDRDELISLYQFAVALVYTSVCGPENLPPLEAFALGCPVVASKISGSVEQLQDAAILVNGLNEDEIIEALLKIKNNPDYKQQLVHKGYLRAQKYTETEFNKDVLKIFSEFQQIRSLWGNHE